MSFHESSHCKKWLLNKELIAALRLAANSRSITSSIVYTLSQAYDKNTTCPPPISSYVIEDQGEEDGGGDENTNDPSCDQSQGTSQRKRPRIEPSDQSDSITINPAIATHTHTNTTAATTAATSAVDLQEEDVLILQHFCGLIQKTFGPHADAGRARYWRVAATAITFFQRFYINNSLASHDPRIVMLTCIFLAGKVEENFIHFQDLLSILPGATEASIIKYERMVMQGIGFSLRVFHPQSIAKTLIADMKRLVGGGKGGNGGGSLSSSVNMEGGESGEQGKDDDKDKEKEYEQSIKKEGAGVSAATTITMSASDMWAAEADKVLEVLQRTYASLCFTPLVIALFALKHTEPTDAPMSVDQYLRDKYTPNPNPNQSSTTLLKSESSDQRNNTSAHGSDSVVGMGLQQGSGALLQSIFDQMKQLRELYINTTNTVYSEDVIKAAMKKLSSRSLWKKESKKKKGVGGKEGREGRGDGGDKATAEGSVKMEVAT